MSYNVISYQQNELEKSLERLNSILLLYFGSTKFEDDWPSQPHSHDYLEIFIVLNGSGKLCIDNTVYKLTKNSIAFINADTPHTEISDKDDRLEYLFFAVDNLKINEYPLNHFVPPSSCPVITYDNSALQANIYEIVNQINSKSLAFSTIIKNYLILILIDVAQNIYIDGINADENQQYNIIKKYIDENYTSKITLDELAQKCFVSRWHLTRMFKQSSGYSPFQYITNKRLEAAKDLLRKTDYSITKIAYEIGFDSPSYFTQVFKKSFNISPKNYRKLKGQMCQKQCNHLELSKDQNSTYIL